MSHLHISPQICVRTSFCKICKTTASSNIKIQCSLAQNPEPLLSNYKITAPRVASLSDQIKKGDCIYNPSAYHLHLRAEIIDWMSGLSAKLRYSAKTLHLSIYLLDGLMSFFEVPDRLIKLATYTALHLAAKFEENGDKIPSFTSVIELFGYEYTMEELTGFETHFFKAFDYYINRRTVYSEIQELLSRGVLCCSDLNDVDTSAEIQLRVSRFKTVVQQLTDTYIKQYQLYSFDPKLIAICIIKTARKFAGMSQWPYDLRSEKKTMIDQLSDYMLPITALLEPFIGNSEENMLIEKDLDQEVNSKTDQGPRTSLCDTEVDFGCEIVSDDDIGSPRSFSQPIVF